MGRTGGHIEGGGDKNDLCAPQTHTAGQLLEPQVEADAKPHGAEFRFKGSDGIAGGEGVGFHESLPALHIDVKEMCLAVLGQKLTLTAVDIAGVVDFSVSQFRQGTAHNVDSKFGGQSGQGGLDRAAFGFSVYGKAVVPVGAAEHFR